jgi:polyisoprenyl-teichoic acid--peptidoglycan teichoic acid transferase
VIKRILALAVVVALVSLCVPLLGAAPSAAGPALFGRLSGAYQPNKGKIFILVIGNDARTGNPDRSRADAIHIVGVNTRTMRAGILNFPRDSWVNIPGYGSAKMNEALYHGGPELMAQTLENVTGIELDYWVMTGFQGFRGIIEELGGVKMRIPTDVFDPTGSGAKIKAGTQNLGPLNALAYVRTRHSFSSGDIARSTHQADFLIAMLKKLHRQVESNPAVLLGWLAIAREHARLNLSPDEQFRLGILASQIAVKKVGNVTVPVSVGSVGAASVVFISPSALNIYQRFRQNGSL